MTIQPVSRNDAGATSRVLDFRPGMGMWGEITKSSAETGGEYFETRNHVGSSPGGPPVHVHPTAEESYAVLDGRLDVFVDGEWQTLGAGESITVRAGTAHTLDNRSGAPIVLVNTDRPALRFEQMFRELHALIRDGKLTLPPRGPRAAIYGALFFSKYAREQRTTKPPQFVFDAIARVGRGLGFELDSGPSAGVR